MSSAAVIATVIAYIAVLFVVSYLSGRKSDNAGFFIGNHRTTWYMAAFAMISAAMSGAIGFTYGAFFLPLRCIDNTVSVYWSLYAAVVIVLLTHIAYTCGGLKVKRQNEKIKRTNRMIYGDHPGAKSVIGQKPIEEIVQENAKHDKRRRKKRERRKK